MTSVFLCSPSRAAESKPAKTEAKPAKSSAAKPAPGKASEKKPDGGTALPLQAPATGPITVALVIERFERLEGMMRSLSSDFSQTVHFEATGSTQSVHGTVAYRSPGLLRLEHLKPERQTAVADGQWLWVWRHETNQVIQTKLEEWKRSEPLAQGLLDFGNYAALLRTYQAQVANVSAPDKEGHRSFELKLTPKGAAGKDGLVLSLGMSTRDFFPAQASLRLGEVIVRSSFSKVRLNPELEDSLFKFKPPPGADVFNNIRPPTKE